MAIRLEQQYPDKTTPASADYPHGQARNVTTPGDGTGTPLEQAWVNDLFGWQQALLTAAGITPSGVPDTARNSQHMEALRALFVSLDSDLIERIEKLENKVYEDISVNQLMWVEQHFETGAEVAAWKGYGTWERALKGRVPVGFSDIVADPAEFKTFGATYGEATHTLVLAETPSHTHSNDPAYNKFSARGSDTNNPSANQTTEFNAEKKYAAGEMSPPEWDNATEQSRGGDQPHNNIQPSKTLDCWKRIA